MRLSHLPTLALLAAATFCAAAQAQQPGLTGAWSAQTNTPQGPVASTLSINPDGTFVRADRLATGTMLAPVGPVSRATDRPQFIPDHHADPGLPAAYELRCGPPVLASAASRRRRLRRTPQPPLL